MAKKPLINKWKEYHDYLVQRDLTNTTNKMKDARAEIERLCGWSSATFYRKLTNPGGLSISEKLTIAEVCGMPPHFLFPELETQTA